VAFASPDPESIATTFAPRWWGRDVSSRTYTAMWARFTVTGSTSSRSHINRYSASPRAYASIVRGARPRSVQICSHTAACSCRLITGHFSLTTTVPLKPSPKSVVAPREHNHPGRFHVTVKMIKRQMYGRAGLPLLRKRVLLTAQNQSTTRAVSTTK
jgi:hypothetical protein